MAPQGSQGGLWILKSVSPNALGVGKGPLHVLGFTGWGLPVSSGGKANGEEPVRSLPSAGGRAKAPLQPGQTREGNATMGGNPIGVPLYDLVAPGMCGIHGSRSWRG
jgi:hypothetical protein